jgi:predicted acyl esterase
MRSTAHTATFHLASSPTWELWLVDDQREASGRTDVLSFTSDILTAPLKISGEPEVHLIASSSGTDSDWVVKLIDVYRIRSHPNVKWAATNSPWRWKSCEVATGIAS